MIQRLYFLRCDGCRTSFTESGAQAFPNPGAARLTARRYAWERIPKRSASHPNGSNAGADLCPRCYQTAGRP